MSSAGSTIPQRGEYCSRTATSPAGPLTGVGGMALPAPSSPRMPSARSRFARTSRSRPSASAPPRARRADARASCSSSWVSRTTPIVQRQTSLTVTSGDSGSRGVPVHEPAAGLPEAEVPDFAAAVETMRGRGSGVLLVDHNVALVLEVCERVHVLDQGTTLAEGTPTEIRAQRGVAAAYLGESAAAEDLP